MPAKCFIRAVATAQAGSEKFETILHYAGNPTVGDEPTSAELILAATDWISVIQPGWQHAFPTDVVALQLEMSGWKTDGEIGTTLPVLRLLGGSGSVTPATRDGNWNCAIIRPVVGTLVSLGTDVGTLKKTYWAFGPVTSACITDTGIFDYTVMGSGVGVALLTALSTGITVGAVGYDPVKVSHRDAHVRQAAITSYRPILTAGYRSLASFRRSRANGR